MPPHLENIDNEQFNYWLSRFVIEVRNKNGEHYHSGTLYSICAGLQRYIREKRMKDNLLTFTKFHYLRTSGVYLTVC